MKVYFTASLSGKEKYGKNYKRIAETLVSLGYKVASEHVLGVDPQEVKNATDKELVKYYRKTLTEISASDLVVAEVSQPTIGIGHEISMAIEKGKPVLVFLVEGAPIPQILKAIQTGNVKVVKYTLENIGQLLSSSISNIKSVIAIRFNFFISPEINEYLDWISRVRRTPRAVYLRELVEKEMEKNKEYKGTKS